MAKKAKRWARRRRQEQQGGRVFVRVEGVLADGLTVRLPGVSSEQWRQAQERAQTGDVHAPEIWCLVEALSALSGHELDPSLWGDEDLREFTRWVGLVDADVWSGVDEQELASLLRGGLSDV